MAVLAVASFVTAAAVVVAPVLVPVVVAVGKN